MIEPIEPQVADSYDLLRADCGRYPTDDLVLVELSGEDRKGWLQGQATNNLRSLDFGASSAFCICEPTGQIISVCEIWSLKDRFLISLPKGSLDGFLRRVEQMVIIEDVVAKVLDDHRLISIQGPSATQRLGELAQLPTLDANEAELGTQTVALLRSNRAGLGGWDVVVPADAKKAITKLEKEFEPIDHAAAEIARLEAGVPKFGQDINPKIMPPELGNAFDARYVSYNKGCYTGQEVLMRIQSRGHTNKTWMGLIADDPFEVGGLVKHSRRTDAGEVTSATFSPSLGYIGAAILRNEAASDGEWVTIESSSGPVQAEVREMPIMRLV
ncbi:MAG: aminomethyl transferase family protein [Chlorobia bacterium]|nr:aminomethyl transferase family protein [Fimbriimonadaceae bacterium]